MKTILLIFGLILSQASYALPNAVERFDSLIPSGTYQGDDCQVRVTRTIRGNTRVRVTNTFRKMSIVILKNQFYRYVPGEYFSVISEKEKSYIFFSSSQKGQSILIGKNFISEGNTFSRNVECVLY